MDKLPPFESQNFPLHNVRHLNANNSVLYDCGHEALLRCNSPPSEFRLVSALEHLRPMEPDVLDFLLRPRTLHRAIFLLKHVLEGFANKNRPVHRCESTDLTSRALVDSCNLTLGVDLDRANIECGLRKKYVHLH